METIETIETTDEEKCFAVCVCVVLLLSLFMAVQGQSHHLGSGFLGFLPRLRHVLMRCLTFIRSPRSADAHEKLLDAAVAERKQHLARCMDWYVLISVNFALFSVLYNILVGRERWLHSRAAWIMLAHQLPILLSLFCPVKISPNWHYIYFQLMPIFLVSPVGESSNLLIYSLMAFLVVSLPAAVIPTRLSMVLAVQVCPLGFALYRSYSECLGVDDSKFCASGESCCDLQVSYRAERTLAFSYIAFVVGAGAIFCMANALIKHQVTSKMRESDKQVQLSAAESLLDLTCDAVIELDASLRLKTHSTKLAALLLRTGFTSLEGVAFVDLLVQPADVPQILDRNQDTSSSAALAFQQMIDSCGNKFKVEVFSVKHSLSDGQKYHILGLRDLEDQESLARRKLDASDLGDALSERSLSRQEVETCRSDQVSSSESLGNLGQWRLKPPQMAEAPKENFLDLDVDGQVVVAATAPFRYLAGQKLPQMFGPESLSLFWRICQEERQAAVTSRRSHGAAPWWSTENIPNRLVTFTQMPFLLPKGVLEISGSMKVTANGDFHVIMCFVESPSSHQTSL